MSSSIATVAQSTSMKQSAINAVQQLLVENVAPMSDASTTDTPSGAGNVETKSEKKPRAPKKVKPTTDAVVDGSVTEGDVTVVESAKPEKKPRAPKKVKPTVDTVVDGAVAVDSAKPEKKPRAPKKVKPTVDTVVVGAVAVDSVVVENAKPEKKPRAPKKVNPTVDTVVDGVVVESTKPEKKPRAPKKVKTTVDMVEPVVAVVDNTKSEKKTRAPKKDKATVESKIDGDGDSNNAMILQFIDKMSETHIIDKDTYNKLYNVLFPNKSTSTVENVEQPLDKSDVVIEGDKSQDLPKTDDDDDVQSEIEEELVTTEFVHKGVLYLKDADDNLYSRNPPHEFVLNLLE